MVSKNKRANIEYPREITLAWLYQHVPLKIWSAFLGFLAAAFFAGQKVSDWNDVDPGSSSINGVELDCSEDTEWKKRLESIGSENTRLKQELSKLQSKLEAPKTDQPVRGSKTIDEVIDELEKNHKDVDVTGFRMLKHMDDGQSKYLFLQRELEKLDGEFLNLEQLSVLSVGLGDYDKFRLASEAMPRIIKPISQAGIDSYLGGMTDKYDIRRTLSVLSGNWGSNENDLGEQ